MVISKGRSCFLPFVLHRCDDIAVFVPVVYSATEDVGIGLAYRVEKINRAVMRFGGYLIICLGCGWLICGFQSL